jgi:LPS sulfotransferase NodH
MTGTSNINSTTILMDSNLMDSNSNVQRFMILGSARTGSNFLLSLLSAHPHIKTYGELFNLDSLPQESLLQALEDPVTFLRRRVYKTHGPEITAVGFKMFYDHLTRDYFQKPLDLSEASPQLQEKLTQFSSFMESNYTWEILNGRFLATWEFLRDDLSLAIIHLKRRNLLQTLISLKMAFITRQWWSLKSSPQTTLTMHLDPEECGRYFQMLDGFAAEADLAFAHHPKIEVMYEDLVAEQQVTLQQIFKFLKVPNEPVTTRMKKQNLVSPRETVANYGQLKDHFRHTRWDVYFE